MKLIREVLKIIVVIIFMVAAYNVCKLTPYYIDRVTYEEDEIRMIIDDSEKTKSLPNPAIIDDEEVLLSIDTIKKYFDEYIYFDEKYNTVIAASGEYVVKMPLGSRIIDINDEYKNVKVSAKKINETVYIPIKELSDVYDIDVTYNEKVIITTGDAKFYTVSVNKKIHTKKYEREFCLTTEVVSKKEKIDIFNEEFETLPDDTYVWVRTEEGSLGYVKKSNIGVESIESTPRITSQSETSMPRISLTWEYASNYTPDRTSEKKIDGLDIVSPTWVYVTNTSGDIKENVSTSYINWALTQGYDVWPTIKNDDIGIDKTSVLLNDMHARKNFVDKIINLCEKYNFKGINLDFEHMYMNDKEEYAELVRELSSTLRRKGIISSVDVNVPDGSANWSLCFDSKAISDAVDYIIVMAYDQYGASSATSGPVASLAWVEANLKKMIERDKIDNKKLVLGVPFYSRFWKEKNGVVTSTSALSMEKAKEYMSKNKNNTVWNEVAGQYVVNYKSKSEDVIIWVEDENSLEKKLELMNKYELAGVASWRRGFETNGVWEKIEEAMK